MTTQFTDETNWEAIINDNSLDTVDKESYLEFVQNMGYSKESNLPTLEMLYLEWVKFND